MQEALERLNAEQDQDASRAAQRAALRLRELANHLDALVCLGGGGTQKNALQLKQKGPGGSASRIGSLLLGQAVPRKASKT